VLVLSPTQGTLHLVVSNLKHSNCGGQVMISNPSHGGVVVVNGALQPNVGSVTLVGGGGGEGLEGGVVTVIVLVTVAHPVWQVLVHPVTVEVVSGTTQGTVQVVSSIMAQAMTGGQVIWSWPSQAV